MNGKESPAILVLDSTRIGSPMARQAPSPLARGESQLVPRTTHRPTDERITRDGDELKPFDAAETASDAKPIAGKCLSADDLAHIVGEVLEW